VLSLAAGPGFGSAAHAVMLLHSPHTFDATLYELWVTLLNGGRVVVGPAAELDLGTVADLIEQHGITALWLTAGLFRVAADEAPEIFRGVREVWTGGDVVPAAAVRRVLSSCPGTRVVNGYGPTETTVFASTYPLGQDDAVPDTLPVGYPLAGTATYVLDAALRLLPPDVVGEVYIAGCGVGRGYLGRPGLTSTRYPADPFGPPGSRMYRTGDLGRRTADGVLHFAGRTDDQVKIRGFRAEPGEVETAAAALPGVASAVVTVQDGADAKQLVCYVVPAPGHTLDGPAVRDSLRAVLPDYLVPAAVVPLARIPLGANGKLDRGALPHHVPAAGPHRPPSTPAERAVARLFADAFGSPEVGLDDDFFALGGDSVTAIRVAARARTARLAISPHDIFTHKTVGELAAVAAAEAPAEADPVPDGRGGGRIELEPADLDALEAEWGAQR
jgi:acyl-CoA synthetase (AMP-forming)/AMP-acid ligase II